MAKGAKAFVKKAPLIGGVALVAEISITREVTSGNVLTGATVATGAIAVIATPAVAVAVGTVYLIGNIISYITTGETIETHVNKAIDKMGVSKNGGTIFSW